VEVVVHLEDLAAVDSAGVVVCQAVVVPLAVGKTKGR
jgi:hypothetical protein